MNSTVKNDSPVLLVSALATLLACVLTTHAFAGESTDQVRSERIGFQDLNVDSPAGIEALYQRIHAASERVCSESGQWGQVRARACAAKAEAGAVANANLPALSAYYRMKTGKNAQTLEASR
jgi:UrcA family protein